MYYLSQQLDEAETPITEQIKICSDSGKVFQFLQLCVDNHVIPLILALEHPNTTTTAGGHFTALRLPPAVYSTWPKESLNNRGMHQRLSDVLSQLGFPKYYGEISYDRLVISQLETEDSEYHPSEASEDSDSIENARTLPETRSHPERKTSLLDDSDFEDNDTTTLNGNLLQALEHGQPITRLLSHRLRHVREANNQACTQWISRYCKKMPSGKSGLHEIKDPLHKSSFQELAPSLFIDLTQSLPFPELILANVDQEYIIKIGAHCIAQGTHHKLGIIYDTMTDASGRQFITEWRQAIRGCQIQSTLIALCLDYSRWQRIDRVQPLVWLHSPFWQHDHNTQAIFLAAWVILSATLDENYLQNDLATQVSTLMDHLHRYTPSHTPETLSKKHWAFDKQSIQAMVQSTSNRS
jgi:hypothetical protein